MPNFAKLLLLSHWCWNPISNILIANFIARISQEKKTQGNTYVHHIQFYTDYLVI
jgi:hypothetical protein